MMVFYDCSFVSLGQSFLSLVTVILNHFPSIKWAARLYYLLLEDRLWGGIQQRTHLSSEGRDHSIPMHEVHGMLSYCVGQLSSENTWTLASIRY